MHRGLESQPALIAFGHIEHIKRSYRYRSYWWYSIRWLINIRLLNGHAIIVFITNTAKRTPIHTTWNGIERENLPPFEMRNEAIDFCLSFQWILFFSRRMVTKPKTPRKYCQVQGNGCFGSGKWSNAALPTQVINRPSKISFRFVFLQLKVFIDFCIFRYYYILISIVCFLLPTLIPVYFWSETMENAIFIAVMGRWMIVSNGTFSVNSFAHMFGNKPYDRWVDELVFSVFTKPNVVPYA